MPGTATHARETALPYQVLARELAAVGLPLDGSSPVIHDFPIWLAETAAGPDASPSPYETPSDVLDLANGPEVPRAAADRHRGRRKGWPQLLDGSTDPAAACFEEVSLPVPPTRRGRPDRAVRVFRINCDAAPVATATLP